MQELFSFLARSATRGSRSTVLQPIQWILTITGAGAVGSSVNGPTWLAVVFTVAFVLTLILGVAAFVYLLLNDRDSLRSERFSIEKMIVEKGMRGDTAMGFLEGARASQLPSVPEDNE